MKLQIDIKIDNDIQTFGSVLNLLSTVLKDTFDRYGPDLDLRKMYEETSEERDVSKGVVLVEAGDGNNGNSIVEGAKNVVMRVRIRGKKIDNVSDIVRRGAVKEVVEVLVPIRRKKKEVEE